MNKPAIMLLHGAIGSKVQLAPIKALLEKDFEVHSLNFSGHGGRAYGAGEFTVNAFVGDVLEYMDGQGIEACHFFGYSMGGYVALSLGSRYPDRVTKLFTLATKLNWTEETAQEEIKNLNADKIAQKVPKFAEILKNRHAPNDWKELLAKTINLLEGLGNGLALGEDDYQQIAAPTTISVGADDGMVSVAESGYVASMLPNGRLKIFEGFKHPIEQIDNQVLCTEITQFFLA